MRITRLITTVSIFLVLTVSIIDIVSSQEMSAVIITQVELVTVSENEAGWTWITNIPTDTKLEYGTTDNLDSEVVLDEATMFHSIYTEELQADTTYLYRLGSGDKWTQIRNFTTLSTKGEDKGFTMVLMGDAHIDMDGQNNGGGSMYQDSPLLFRSAVSQLNQDQEIDMVVFLGDMVNGDPEDYAEFFDIVGSLTHPWVFTFGNWEKNLENWEEIASSYMDVEHTYYSFDRSGYHFIILDSSVYGEIGGTLDDDQFTWLEEDLSGNEGSPTLLFMHHPMEETGVFTLDDLSKSRLNDLMDRNGQIISVVAGHNHKNKIVEKNMRYHSSIGSIIQYPIGYSEVNLYEGGISQHFLKVTSELQTSEESKIRMDASGGSKDTHTEYLGEISDRSAFMTIIENRSPVIVSMDVNPKMVHQGDDISVSVDAFDPDHDIMDYSYFLDGELISQQGPTITIKAPQTPGDYILTASVGDNQESIQRSESITVVSDDIDIDEPPEIITLTSDKDLAKPGETVTITVSAEDPDNDPISYQWTAEGGKIDGNGNSIQWTAPDQPGNYFISVIVKANGLSDEGSIDIEVKEFPVKVVEKRDTPMTFVTTVLGVLSASVIMIRKRKISTL